MNDPVLIPMRFRMIEESVCREFGITPEILRDQAKLTDLVHARWMVWLMASDLLGFTDSYIGRLSDRDRTSIAYGISRAKELGLEVRAYEILNRYMPGMAAEIASTKAPAN